jgi:hypothetical protein
VLIEALPPVLVLHLKRFLYDTAARGVVKVGKPVQFTPELEIPLGTLPFSPSSFQSKLRILYLAVLSVQISWLPLPDHPHSPRAMHSTVCSTTTACLQAADTIRSMFSTRTVTAARGAAATVVAKLGSTSTMRR